MLNRAERNRKVRNILHGALQRIYIRYLKYVDIFVYEIGRHETDLEKRAKIDDLRLSGEEWERAAQFSDLLSVRHILIVLLKCATD